MRIFVCLHWYGFMSVGKCSALGSLVVVEEQTGGGEEYCLGGGESTVCSVDSNI